MLRAVIEWGFVMLRRLAMVVIVSLLAGLAMAQDNPPRPAGDQAQGRPIREGEGWFRGVAGTITAIKKEQLFLKAVDGKAVTVNLSARTRYRKDAQPATLADFKVGDRVMVSGDPAGENTWDARSVSARARPGAHQEMMREALGKRFIAGEIKSIDGTRLAILRPDGVTQTIEVDENTSFRKQGESITLADFKPGDHVFGRGELKNGTFVAAVLNVGDFPQMGPSRFQGSPDRH